MQKILRHDTTGAELVLDTAASCVTCPPNVTAMLHERCMLLPKGPDSGVVLYYCDGLLCLLTLRKLPGPIATTPAPWLAAWIASPKVNKAVRTFPWVLSEDHDTAMEQLMQQLAGLPLPPATPAGRSAGALGELTAKLMEVGRTGLRDYAHNEPARRAHVIEGSRKVLQAADNKEVAAITQYLTVVDYLAYAMRQFGGVVQLEFDSEQNLYVVHAGTQAATYHTELIEALQAANRALLAVVPAPMRNTDPEHN